MAPCGAAPRHLNGRRTNERAPFPGARAAPPHRRATAHAETNAQDTKAWIEADFPGIYVKNVEIGNGRKDSYEMEINDQVADFARQLQQDPRLQGGFNLVGHSQGGLIARAYTERYNSPRVHNLILWAAPNAGIYGVPNYNAACPDKKCPWLDALLDALLYDGGAHILSMHFSFVGYWKDPFR